MQFVVSNFKMKLIILIGILTSFSLSGLAQSRFNIDSLTQQICNTVKTDIKQTDSLTLTNALLKHLAQYSNQTDKNGWKSLVENCYLRLQRECPEFKYILNKLEPSKGDWKRANIEPDSKVSLKDCSDFFKISKFKYLEHTGDTSKVIITDSSWTDYFLDGSYSKLSLIKTNNCDFVITFIESNNYIRNGFSKPGDKYRYKILQKFDTYYEMFIEIPGSTQMQTFRLYY